MCHFSHPAFAELTATASYAISIHFMMLILIYAVRRY